MKNKIVKILGVVLTLTTLASMFVFASPVSAGAQAWSEFATPSATNLVIPNNITASGPMAQASDGSALWVAANVGGTWRIIKSTDGGRTWPTAGRIAVVGNVPVTAMAASPTEPGVLYYTTGSTLYKSVDAGATYIAEANIPAGTINTMDVAKYLGRYIVVVGTTNAPGNVYWMDENDVFFNFQLLGTNDFNTAVGGGVTKILAVALSPNFGAATSDRFVAAIGVNATQTVMGINQFGGAWGANIANLAPFGGVNTTAAIAYPSDFNVTTSPNFFFGVGGAAGAGVYAFNGALVTSTSVLLTGASSLSSFNRNVVSLDVTGTFAAGSLYAGNQAGGVLRSTDSGASWSTKQLNTNPNANRVYVQVKNGATSPLYVLVGGTSLAPLDDTAFYLSASAGVFHAVSLINNTQVLKNMEVTANSEVFLSVLGGNTVTTGTTFGAFTITSPAGAGSSDSFFITSANAATGDAFTLTATAAGSVTVAGAVAITVLAGAPGIVGAAPFQTVNFTAAADAVTVTATAAGSITWSITAGPAVTAAETVDPNASMTVAASGVPFAADMNPTIATLSSAGTFSIVATGGSVVGSVWTSSAAGQTATVTTTSATTITVNVAITLNTGTASLGPVNDPNLSTLGPTTLAGGANGDVTGLDNNPSGAVVTVNSGTATVLATTGPSGIVSTIGAVSTITFTAGAQVVTVTATSAVPGPSVTLALSGMTPTLAVTVGTFTPAVGTFTIPVVSLTISPDYLWRNIAGVWERVYQSVTAHALDIMKSDPAYATTKTLFIANYGTTAILKSTNNGDSFAAAAATGGMVTVPPGTVNTMAVIDANTVVVGGGTADSIFRTANNGTSWITSTVTGLGTVTSIIVASNGDLLAAGISAGTIVVAQAPVATPTVWGAISAVVPVAATPTRAEIDVADDYATSGAVFVSGDTAGIYTSTVTTWNAATAPWAQVDPATAVLPLPSTNNWYQHNGAAFGSLTFAGQTFQTTSVGGPGGGTAEGTGMLYVASQSGVARVKGHSKVTELIPSPATLTINGLYGNAASATLGSVTFYTIASDGKIYAYTDTLNLNTSTIAVTAPLASMTSTSAVVSFPTVANATGYAVFVNTKNQTSLYTAATSGATVGSVVISTDGKTATVSVTGLAASSTYFVSVWAINGTLSNASGNNAISSFMFGSSFTTVPSFPDTPQNNLVPAPGAQNVQILVNFQWKVVPGATSYELWLDTKSDLSTAQKYTNIPAPANTLAVDWSPPAPLANNTLYYWQVRAVNATGPGIWNGVWSFTTVAVVPPPVTVTNVPAAPTPTIIITAPPQVTVTAASPVTPIITFPGLTVTQLPAVTPPTPAYIWVIVGVGALLTLAVIVLIIRTRRVV